MFASFTSVRRPYVSHAYTPSLRTVGVELDGVDRYDSDWSLCNGDAMLHANVPRAIELDCSTRASVKIKRCGGPSRLGRYVGPESDGRCALLFESGPAARVESVSVVVPAHNERRLLATCLQSIAIAAHNVSARVSITVVLDACTDGTVAEVPSWVTALEVGHRSVGAARRAGCTDAIGRDVDPTRLWLLNTDADCVVPPDWIARHLRHAEDGADLVIGAIALDDDPTLPAAARRRYQRSYPGRAATRVHGANLGISARTYLAVGGFPAVDVHEDVLLADRCRAFRVRRDEHSIVRTSARLVGRAPRGLSTLLTELAEA